MSNNPSANEIADIHKAIAIEIMEEMQRGKDVSTILNKDNIVNLINKIKAQDSQYYLCHLDLKGTNTDKVNHFNENQGMLFKALVKDLKERINFDVEFYKIGQTCNGLRKRYAIVLRGGFYSSKEPIARFNREKAKDKTPFLYGSTVYLDNIEAWRRSTEKNKGEWSNQRKPWRMRINFKDPKGSSGLRSFFMYFETEEQMKEVEEMLFGMRCGKEKTTAIISNLQQIQKCIEGSYIFYGMLKMLSVKSKVKTRKDQLKTLKNYSNQSYDSMIQFGRSFLKSSMIDKYKQKKGMFNGSKLYYAKEIVPAQQNCSAVLRSKGAKNKPKRSDFDDTSGYNYSAYQPMLTAIPGKEKERDSNECESYTDMKKNVNILKEGLEKVLKNNKENGEMKCWKLDENIEFKNYTYTAAGHIPNEAEINKTSLISVNKKEGQLLFTSNDTDIPIAAVFTSKNVYDISNVIINSNKDINDREENRVVILGPKKESNKSFTYKYKNDQRIYMDPDNAGLKFDNNQPEEVERRMITLQIFQCVYEMTQNDLQQLSLVNAEKGIKISTTEPQNDLYFYLTIRVGENKIKQTKMRKAKVYSHEHFVIEFNTEITIQEKEILNEKIVYVQVNMIPIGSFEPNAREDERNLLVDYMKPINMGAAEITKQKIAHNINEYLLNQNGVQLSDSTRLLVQCIPEITIAPPSTSFVGKEYAIGSDMYLIQTIDKTFFDQGMKNPTLSKDIRQKYYDVQFNDNGEFLFRPNEEMSEEDFIKEFENIVSPEELNKIIYNKRYKFLPQCEKYVSKDALDRSKNLAALPPEEKRIVSMMNEGEWIYKCEKLNMRILSRNMGVTDEREITQLNYFAGIRQIQHYNSMNNLKDFCPISENTFNLLDMNDLEPSMMKNFDNFQYMLTMKFKNPQQMMAFIKALRNIRQTDNLKVKLVMIDKQNTLSYKTTINEVERTLLNDISNVKLIVQSLEFRDNCQLEEDSTLNVSIVKAEEGVNNKGGKSLIENLELDYYGYKNSLLENPEMKETLEKIKKMHMDSIDFPFSPVIRKEKFNSGKKTLQLGKKMNKDFECKSFEKQYQMLITFEGVKSGKKDQYVSDLDLSRIISEKSADIMVTPLIHKDSPDERIEGILHLNAWIVDKNNKEQSFEDAYIKVNEKEIAEFNFRDRDGIQLSKGRYEPNVLRRKILNGIRNKFNMGIEDLMYEIRNGNEDLSKKLYEYLKKKCIILPEQISSFNPDDIKLNISKDTTSDSYNKKMIFNFLICQKRREFFDKFSNSEWLFFFRDITKNKELKANDDMFYYFPKNKAELFKSESSINRLRSLIYQGFPNIRARAITWEYLLNIEKLYQLTKDKLSKDKDIIVSSKDEIFEVYKNQIQNGETTNIIFTLIDNDTNYIKPIKQDQDHYEYIETIKTIAKAFFLWTELDIRLDETKKEKKYVYFVGMLSVIQRLYHSFGSDSATFWFIIGFAQYIDLFQEENPIYNGDISHMSINVYVLVTKLILELHCKEIYNKFLSLNYPIEQFISKQLNSLYSEYFQSNLLFRVFDILLFEASCTEFFGDSLRYLRILCTIPITIFQMNEKNILAAQSVSELETIVDDFVIKTYANMKFIGQLQENVLKFYSYNNFFEKMLNLNADTKWDSKRENMQQLIYDHFSPVQQESTNYLKKVSTKESILGESRSFVENYFQGLVNKLDNLRKLYGFGTPNIGVPGIKSSGICIHINKLISNTSSNPLHDSMVMRLLFSERPFDWDRDNPMADIQKSISYDVSKGEIINKNDLIIESEFESTIPKYVNFLLLTDLNQPIGVFSFDLSKTEIMNIEKVTLESRDKYLIKIMLEISFMKYSLQNVSSDDLALFNVIFASPEYKHNTDIENNLSSVAPNGIKTLASMIPNAVNPYNNELKGLIMKENEIKNVPISKENAKFQDIQNISEIYKANNIYNENMDGYSTKSEKILKNDTKDEFAKKITSKVEDLLKSLTAEENLDILMSWLKSTNVSFEEVLYCLVLIDKASYTISEKMYLLFSIAQMKNKLLFNSDKVSIKKVKEMFYALYKRYMIYFTKNDVDRMIDFALKDEKLLNVKYALVYSEENKDKIEKIIFDHDRYSKNIQLSQKQSEVPFDDITSDFNAHINHIVNHYNMKSLNSEILKFIISQLISNSANKKKYTESKCNIVHIVVSKDNIQYSKVFRFSIGSTVTVEEIQSNPIILDDSDITGLRNCLLTESSNFEVTNTYAENMEISFSTFKQIFFTLPFISDLIRESCVFISEKKENIDKVFDVLKVSVQFNNENFANYFFPDVSNSYMNVNNNSPNVNTNSLVKSSMTIKDIRDKICESIRNSNRSDKNVNSYNSAASKLDTIVKYLANPEVFECYVVNEKEKIDERILFFESLYSNMYLKNQKKAEIKFVFNSVEMSINENGRMIKKDPGFAKFYWNPLRDFEWRKCKIASSGERDKEIIYISCDFPSKIRMKDDEFLVDYMGEGKSNLNLK